jgi:hypothetical protein
MAALVLVVSACGAGGGDNPFAGASEPIDPTVAGAADVLVERWGAEGAFFVTLVAFDLGYSAEQVIAGVAGMGADGTIPDVDPAGPPLGMLSETGLDGQGPPSAAPVITAPVAVGVVAYGPDDATPQDTYVVDVGSWASELWEAGQDSLRTELTMTDVVLGLAAQGYSLDQIVEALVAGEWELLTAGDNACFIIIDAAGPWVAPDADPIAGLNASCAVVSESGPPDVVDEGSDDPTTEGSTDGTRVYRGTAEFVMVAGDPQNLYPENECTVAAPAEMEVLSDGTLTLSITWTAWPYQGFESTQDPPRTGCRPYPEIHPNTGDSYTSVKVGIWSGSQFGASVADPVHARSSSSPNFDGEFVGDSAVALVELEFEGVGVRYVRVLMDLDLDLVSG